MSKLSFRVAALLLPVVLGTPIVGASAQEADGDVTIYRCTGADGQVVIGNVPCADDADQQVRSMVRPVDGTPAPPAATPPPAPAPPPPAVQYVQAQPAQPLYECVRSDGSTYESDTGIGEERWIPTWAGGGWPIGGARGGRSAGGPGGGGRDAIGTRGPTTRAGSGLSAPPVSRISIPANPPRPDPGAATGPRPRPPHGGHQAGGVGGYVERDPCHALPPAEACARLRDRRDTIRDRFFNAQQVERDTLRVEERGLNARIDRDCRTY